MTDWLEILEALPSETEKTKVPVHSSEKTEKSSIKRIQNDLEAAEERAAIMEFDGGLPRAEAEKYAIEKHLKAYVFKCTDGEGTLLARCATIEEARKALEYRFGNKLVDVERIDSRGG